MHAKRKSYKKSSPRNEFYHEVRRFVVDAGRTVVKYKPERGILTQLDADGGVVFRETRPRRKPEVLRANYAARQV